MPSRCPVAWQDPSPAPRRRLGAGGEAAGAVSCMRSWASGMRGPRPRGGELWLGDGDGDWGGGRRKEEVLTVYSFFSDTLPPCPANWEGVGREKHNRMNSNGI